MGFRSVTEERPDGFRVQFTEAAPANAKIDWQLIDDRSGPSNQRGTHRRLQHYCLPWMTSSVHCGTLLLVGLEGTADGPATIEEDRHEVQALRNDIRSGEVKHGHMIRGYCRGVVFAGLALLLARSSAAGEMVVVQNGQPRATIIVAKDVAEPAKGKLPNGGRRVAGLRAEDVRGEAADRGRRAGRGGAGDSRGPEPAERCIGRAGSRRSGSRSPRRGFRDCLPRRPAAPGGQ